MKNKGTHSDPMSIPLGSLKINFDSLAALINQSGVADSVMVEIGFTANAVTNLCNGLYNKVVDTDTAYPSAWEYSSVTESSFLYIFLRRGDGTLRHDAYTLRQGRGTKTWQILFSEL